MSWLQRLLGSAAANASRWVVVDVETSGLDMRRDRLRAIAAIALHVDAQAAPRSALGDSFEAVLRQEAVAAHVQAAGLDIDEHPAAGVDGRAANQPLQPTHRR